jgi:transcriptional regulator with XRE-family HTH domain/sRNA-binding regulator protein Hfq
MQEDLWKIRQEKRMTINDLAAQSEVPALSIYEYEQGRPIRSADLPKLAAALGVADDTIKAQSSPKPRKERRPSRPQRRSAPKRAPTPKPASPTQVKHLIALATKLGQSQEELEEEVGEPLESMNRKEIGKLLSDYTDAIKERKEEIAADSTGTKRWRAHLPEGVDSFELDYLTSQRKAGAELTFALFDGQRFTGRLLGFGPYNITIRTADEQEVTLQKMAIAYYFVATSDDGAES